LGVRKDIWFVKVWQQQSPKVPREKFGALAPGIMWSDLWKNRLIKQNRLSVVIVVWVYSGFRDLPSVLPVNQQLSFSIQISSNVTELPQLPLFGSFQSRGILQFLRLLQLILKSCIVAVITRPRNCIWKMLKKMIKKRLVFQLFTNILDSVLLNYCYYYQIIIMTFCHNM